MKPYKGLRKKLFQGNISILLIAIFVCSSMFFAYYWNAQKKMEYQQLENVSDAASVQIENSIFMLDSICLQVSTNSYIANMLDEMRIQVENHSDLDLLQLYEIDAFIWSYIIRVDVASRICVFDDVGTFIVVGSGVDDQKTKQYATAEYLQALSDGFAQGETKQYTVHLEDNLSTRLDEGYISVIRAVKNVNASVHVAPSGYAEVQLPLASIEKQFVNLAKETYQFALYDRETGRFLAGDNRVVTEQVFASLPSTEKIQSYQNGFLRIQPIENTSYVLCVYNDAMSLYSNAWQMLLLLATFCMAIIGFVALVQVRFVDRITAPLFTLFNQVREKGFSKEHRLTAAQAEVDELAELRDSFDEMLDALQDSSDKLVGAQIGKLRAQLLALQAQIDPHFIHNTLSVIVALAQEENYREVEEVAMRLSEMIRYSSSFDEPMCTMAQELKHLENYLELLVVRYEENFTYQIPQDVREMNFQVPRFIAQPIAENALKYSLKQVETHWNIQVECQHDQYFWSLIITDNGIGITQEKADEIMKQTYLAIREGVDHLVEELKIGGLSLLNIAARLYLTYQDDMIFCICPAEGQGTKVILGGRIDEN